MCRMGFGGKDFKFGSWSSLLFGGSGRGTGCTRVRKNSTGGGCFESFKSGSLCTDFSDEELFKSKGLSVPVFFEDSFKGFIKVDFLRFETCNPTCRVILTGLTSFWFSCLSKMNFFITVLRSVHIFCSKICFFFHFSFSSAYKSHLLLRSLISDRADNTSAMFRLTNSSNSCWRTII